MKVIARLVCAFLGGKWEALA